MLFERKPLSLSAGRECLIRPWLLAAPNTALQNKILEFSLAYFIVDSVHLILMSPDTLFILHHIGGTFYMLSSRAYVKRGALSALSLMGAGELTSPLQNSWTLSRLCKKHSPFAERVYQAISLPFTLVYTVVRLGLGPYLVYEVAQFYVRGGADGVIPRWLAYTWSVIITLAELGSLAWVYMLWAGLIRFYKRRKQAAPKKIE